MKRFTHLTARRIYRHVRQITGNMREGDVFVGEVFRNGYNEPAIDVGTFMVVNDNGKQYCANLLTGKLHRGAAYVSINTDIEPEVELK